MQVELRNISKSFQNHSVFKNVNLTIKPGFKGVILGGNGSGKSTLLKVISAALTPSTGSVTYSVNGKKISDDKRYKQVAFCGPYTELIEDFTLSEAIGFHQKFRPFITDVDKDTILKTVHLNKFEHKPMKTYSSGMKQRVRLALTIMTDTPLLLLDEPTSNLDPAGKEWYKELVRKYTKDRTVIVASNHLEEEYFFTHNQIELRDYQ